MKIWIRGIKDIYDFVTACMDIPPAVQIYQNGEVADAKEVIQVLGRINLKKPAVLCSGSKDPQMAFRLMGIVKRCCWC